jgi:hypothetical protein
MTPGPCDRAYALVVRQHALKPAMPSWQRDLTSKPSTHFREYVTQGPR